MRHFLLLLVFLFVSNSLKAQQAWLHPDLEAKVQRGEKGNIRIGILLHEQINALQLKYDMAAAGFTAEQRARTVIRQALELQEGHQKPFLRKITEKYPEITIAHAYWIANVVLVDMPLSLLPELQREPEIFWLFADDSYLTGLVEPVAVEALETPEIANGREPGLNVINAPALWAMGYTGRNRKAFTVDTGTWTDHPALARRFLGNHRPLNEGWFSLESNFPVDRPSHHGTHVNGTILGLDTATRDTIGVAFNAYFMASNPLTHSNLTPLSINLMSFEWAMNPDGDTSTVSDIPDVINNSWGQAGGPDTTICVSWATQIFNMVEAAGVAITFSAGNEGPGPATVKHPQFVNTSDVNIFSIGAIDGNNASLPIAGFSSRGPSLCGQTGSLLIKPEVVAPGVNVRSAFGKTGYGSLSGTSMSCPHVSGAVVLLKEAFPQLGGDSLLYALYVSAIDMGDPGEDNTFGRGRIDLLAAYNYLAQRHTPMAARRGQDLAAGAINLPANNTICAEDHLNGLNLFFPALNLGDSIIPMLQLRYSLNGSPWQSSLLPVNLGPQQSANLFAGPLAYKNGWNELQIELRIPGQSQEIDEINNFRSVRFFVSPRDTSSPRPGWSAYFPVPADQFVRDSLVQIVDRNGDDISWDTASVGGLNRDSKAFVMRHTAYALRQRQQDDLLTRSFVSIDPNYGAINQISFKLAYRNRNSSFRDSLRVSLECDCGRQSQTLYYSGGDSMRTYAAGNVPSDSSHWRHFSFSGFSPFLQEGCQVRFRSINDFGGNLYIGDLLVSGSAATGIPSFGTADWEIFPNPGHAVLKVRSQLPLKSIQVLDIRGKTVYWQATDQQHHLELQLETLAPGLYFIQGESNAGISVKKWIKQ
jgi:bacillopeptidase F